MATTNQEHPILTPNQIEQINSVEEKIRKTFNQLIDQLIERREALLKRVQQLKDDFCKKESSRINGIAEIGMIQRRMNEISLKENTIINMHKQTARGYQDKLNHFNTPTQFMRPIFKCPNLPKLEDLITKFGDLIEFVIPDYCAKNEPILTTTVKLGAGVNELNAAGISIDEVNELLYISDFGNSRVQVVSLKGEILTSFGNYVLKYPWGITMNENAVYVTDFSQDAVFMFSKNTYQLLNRTDGTSKTMLHSPRGLCVDTDGDVFVADCLNNRVCVFTVCLEFKFHFGNGQLHRPQDVKLSEGVVVLEQNYVIFFSKNGIFKNSFVSHKCFDNATFFCLDLADNLIISDYGKQEIKIMTSSGEVIHSLGESKDGRAVLSEPYGVCVTKLGLIYVVSTNPQHSLQCF